MHSFRPHRHEELANHRFIQYDPTVTTKTRLSRRPGGVRQLGGCNMNIIEAKDWADSPNHKRWIPEGRKLPPALRQNWSKQIERLIIARYMNKIPRREQLSLHKETLHDLLSRKYLSSSEDAQLEEVFHKIEFDRTEKANRRRESQKRITPSSVLTFHRCKL